MLLVEIVGIASLAVWRFLQIGLFAFRDENYAISKCPSKNITMADH